ncbi:hypothetical protein GCM10010991_02620 [Gemmobacter aquaticus]|uniref:Uncharacterized protein n=1 Tax=Gemmobacter aquaticus TaxID=490185 RepID=A0A917YJ05_9RHOB|nr:hypothetical protein GCM10010991_02620 [Gemmobacter aquaticus]
MHWPVGRLEHQIKGLRLDHCCRSRFCHSTPQAGVLPPLFMYLSPTCPIMQLLREDTMNTKTAFVPVTESEDICFAPPILTTVPQKPKPQTPVAGTPVR